PLDRRLRPAARRAGDRRGPGAGRGPAGLRPRARPRRGLRGARCGAPGRLPLAQLCGHAPVAPPRRSPPSAADPPEGPTMTTAPPPLAPADGGRVHRRTTTPLGTYVLAADQRGLVGVWRLEQKRFPTALRMGTAITGPHPVLDEAERQLREYLAGTRVDFALPLAPDGTAFQQAVWQQLTAIPRGRTTTYGQIA